MLITTAIDNAVFWFPNLLGKTNIMKPSTYDVPTEKLTNSYLLFLYIIILSIYNIVLSILLATLVSNYTMICVYFVFSVVTRKTLFPVEIMLLQYPISVCFLICRKVNMVGT